MSFIIKRTVIHEHASWIEDQQLRTRRAIGLNRERLVVLPVEISHTFPIPKPSLHRNIYQTIRARNIYASTSAEHADLQSSHSNQSLSKRTRVLKNYQQSNFGKCDERNKQLQRTINELHDFKVKELKTLEDQSRQIEQIRKPLVGSQRQRQPNNWTGIMKLNGMTTI